MKKTIIKGKNKGRKNVDISSLQKKNLRDESVQKRLLLLHTYIKKITMNYDAHFMIFVLSSFTVVSRLLL